MTGKDERNEDPPKKKSRLWIFDPAVFQPLPRASFFRRRILTPVRSLGKYGLYTLAFSYPLLLVTLGILFGGIVFWSGFILSFVAMYLIIRKAGYARNFAEWGVGSRRFLGLFGAFGLSLAFFYGLTHLRDLFFPIFIGVVVVSFIIGITLHSRQ